MKTSGGISLMNSEYTFDSFSPPN